MKFDLVKSIIAVLISALIAYAFFCISSFEPQKYIILIASFIVLSVTTVLAIGVTLDDGRKKVNLSILSWMFIFLFCLINIIFAFFNFSIPFFVILNGLLTLVYLLIYISINRAKQ